MFALAGVFDTAYATSNNKSSRRSVSKVSKQRVSKPRPKARAKVKTVNLKKNKPKVKQNKHVKLNKQAKSTKNTKIKNTKVANVTNVNIRRTTPRILQNGMYLKNGYVYRRDSFGIERCQRESSYYYNNGPEYDSFVAGSIYANAPNNMHRTRTQFYTSSNFIVGTLITFFGLILITLIAFKNNKR